MSGWERSRRFCGGRLRKPCVRTALSACLFGLVSLWLAADLFPFLQLNKLFSRSSWRDWWPIRKSKQFQFLATTEKPAHVASSEAAPSSERAPLRVKNSTPCMSWGPTHEPFTCTCTVGQDAVHKKEGMPLEGRVPLKSSKKHVVDPTATANLPSVVLSSVHQPTQEVRPQLSEQAAHVTVFFRAVSSSLL